MIDTLVRRGLWVALLLLLVAVACHKPAAKVQIQNNAPDSEIVFKGGLTCYDTARDGVVECLDNAGRLRLRMGPDHDEIYYPDSGAEDATDFRGFRGKEKNTP